MQESPGSDGNQLRGAGGNQRETKETAVATAVGMLLTEMTPAVGLCPHPPDPLPGTLQP